MICANDIWLFFFDENPSAVITNAVESLTAAFEGLDIKKSRVYEYIKNECNLSLKVATLHPGPRNDEKKCRKKIEVGASVDGHRHGFYKKLCFY